MSQPDITHSLLLITCEEILEKKKSVYSDLELALLAYVPSAVERLNEKNDLDIRNYTEMSNIHSVESSKTAKVKVLFNRLKIEFNKTVKKSLILKIKRFFNFNLARYEIPSGKTVVIWQEYYKMPNLDDKPFIDELRNAGYVVKEPGDKFVSIRIGFSNVLKSAFNYSKSVNRIAKEVTENLDIGTDFEVYWYNIIKEALWAPRVLKRVFDAVCLDFPYIQNVSKSAKKTIVINRHLGDLSLVLVDRFRNLKLETTQYFISQIVLDHSAIASDQPLTIQYKNADLIIPKTEISYNKMITWDNVDNYKIANAVGDPRMVGLSQVRKLNDNKNSIVIALSGGDGLGGLECWSKKELTILLSFILKLEGLKKNVKIKVKKPSHDYSKYSSDSVKEGLIDQIHQRFTFNDLPWCIKCAELGILIGSKEKRQLSSIIEDFLQTGVPTIFILINQANKNVHETFENYMDRYQPISYSEDQAEVFFKNYDENLSILKEECNKLSIKGNNYSPQKKLNKIIKNILFNV